MAYKSVSSFSIREILPKFRTRQQSSGNNVSVAQELGAFPGHSNSSNEQKSTAFMGAGDSAGSPQRGGESGPKTRVESRPYFHKYFFRRPRLLQYYDHGELVDSSGRAASADVHEHLVDDNMGDPKIQRDFLNLFTDLLWAGIISNISENFIGRAFEPGRSWGLAFLEFSVLFLTAFKMWNYLRKFLNSFFNKDYLQSMFIIWILVVALYFGNQAPNFLKLDGQKTIIWTYLTAKYSFIAIEVFYSVFIPQIRRQMLISAALALPISALWIGALKVAWPTQAALIMPAIALESLVGTVIELPVGDWFLRGAPKKALDPDNFLERLQSFFIIILGEGVFTLIGSLTAPRVPLGIVALLIYYVLFCLYFSGDLTKTYIHAVFRNRYTAVAFESIHITLYGSLLLLDSSTRYLLSLDGTKQAALDDSDPAIFQDWKRRLFRSRFTVSSALSAVIICVTVKALLNRSLDGPNTLLVNNRYIRVAPRGLVIIAVMCLPLKTGMTVTASIGLLLGLLLPLLLWEYIAAMETGSRLFEPKEVRN